MDLITPAYLESQKVLHARPRGYGGRGYVWASTVLQIADRYKAISILDYGCGQGTFGDAIALATGTRCREYDPAIPGKDARPGFADIVNCTDVLEHIEPHKLDAVLAHIRGLARKAVFLVVATRPSNKKLPDGSNAHLIIESEDWWQARVLSAGFTVAEPPTVHPDKAPEKAWIAVVEP